MAKKSPLQQVKERFGSKEKLAAIVMEKLARPENEEAASFARRIRTMSNRKLVRLHDTFELVNAEFGGKDALVDAIMTMKFPTGKPDLDARVQLEGYQLTRLLDQQRSLTKCAKNAAKKAKNMAPKS